MPARPKANWPALRDEWIERRLGKESMSLREFAVEKQVNYETLRKRFRNERWQEDLQAREARVQDKVAEKIDINHVAERVRLLQVQRPLQHLLVSAANLYRDLSERAFEQIRQMETEDAIEKLLELQRVLPWKDFTAALDKLVKVTEMGAGLPKEHIVRQDDVYDEVMANRAQMQQVGRQVTQLATFKRLLRQGRGRDEALRMSAEAYEE